MSIATATELLARIRFYYYKARRSRRKVVLGAVSTVDTLWIIVPDIRKRRNMRGLGHKNTYRRD